MQYQISYLSPNGHAETIANAFCRMLPGDTYVADLEEDGTAYADVQLVGFEMGGTKLDAIPFKVLEYLENLDGKVFFLFATVPFQPNEAVRNKVNNSVIPFLPDECDYRGLYLCAAQPPESLVRDLRNVIASQPDNTSAKHWLEQCKKAQGHPDTDDLKKGCQFMRHALELDI